MERYGRQQKQPQQEQEQADKKATAREQFCDSLPFPDGRRKRR